MNTLPFHRTGRLVLCILAVLLSTVSGGMPLLGTPGLRADAHPWSSAAPVPQCRTLQPHIPRPCGTLSGVTARARTYWGLLTRLGAKVAAFNLAV